MSSSAFILYIIHVCVYSCIFLEISSLQDIHQLMVIFLERERDGYGLGYGLKREFHFFLSIHLSCLAILQSCVTLIIKKKLKWEKKERTRGCRKLTFIETRLAPHINDSYKQ